MSSNDCAIHVNKSSATSHQVHYTTIDVTNPYAACAEPTRPADGLQNPPDQLKPLWVVASNEVESGDGQAHECIDDITGQVKMSEDETTTTTTPHIPPKMPLEECTPQASTAIDTSTCEPDDAMATWNQGYQMTTSASTQNVLHDHSAKTEMTTDPAGPSKDLET